MIENLRILAILGGVIAVAAVFARTRFGRHLGPALLSLLLAALLVNLGGLPVTSPEPALYGFVLEQIAPFAVFLLLLDARIDHLRRVGAPMLLAFSIGAIAVVVGALAGAGLLLLQGEFATFEPAVTGMYVASLIGGTLNFHAVALHFGLGALPVLYGVAVVIDNLMKALWVIASLLFPGMRNSGPAAVAAPASVQALFTWPAAARGAIAATLLGILAVWGARELAGWLAAHGLPIPEILLLTTMALVVAQTGLGARLAVARHVGTGAIFLLLAVVGARMNVPAVMEQGELALSLLKFVAVIYCVHGFALVLVRLFISRDLPMIAIASSAVVGGVASVTALAASFRREDLLLPGVVAAVLGNVIGTYIGFAIAAFMTSP